MANSAEIIRSNGLSEYGETFLGFLGRFYSKKGLGEIRNPEKIYQACLRMEEVHEGQFRQNGEPYHIHPYLVARIYCKVHGKNISETGIIAAILHDNIENAHKSGQREDFESLKTSFGSEDALICLVLSKADIEDKKERNAEYFERFTSLATLRAFVEKIMFDNGLYFPKDKVRAITIKIAIIKICDRIHNLRTMSGFKTRKIREKITETQDYILPIAKEVGRTHPRILKFLSEAIVQAEKDATRKRASKALSSK